MKYTKWSQWKTIRKYSEISIVSEGIEGKKINVGEWLINKHEMYHKHEKRKTKKWQLCIFHPQKIGNYNTYAQITLYMLFTK